MTLRFRLFAGGAMPAGAGVKRHYIDLQIYREPMTLGTSLVVVLISGADVGLMCCLSKISACLSRSACRCRLLYLGLAYNRRPP